MKNQKKLGLALGGGAALGPAHIGVLKSLEKNNINVHCISGTSIGSLVASLYAFGISVKKIEEISHTIKWPDVVKISFSKWGILKNKKLGELITDIIGDQKIENARLPLSIMTTDIVNGKRFVFDKGPVVTAVMASTCIPGVFKPVEYQNHFLVDGGVMENVPLSALLPYNAEVLVGVDLHLNREFHKPENLIDVITKSFILMLINSTQEQTGLAHLMIKPDLSDFSISRIERTDELIQKGFDAAEENSAVLNRLLFHSVIRNKLSKMYQKILR